MSGPDTLRRSGGVVVALLATLWLAASAQAATCGPAPGVIAGAEVAFVGTMTAVDAYGMQATFAVEEVWKGDVPAAVEVGGPTGQQWADPSMAGARYLVLATVAGGRLLVGVECNHAYLWDPSMAAGRPTTAHPPAGDESDASIEVPLPILLIAGVAVLVGGISLVAFRRPHTPADGAD